MRHNEDSNSLKAGISKLEAEAPLARIVLRTLLAFVSAWFPSVAVTQAGNLPMAACLIYGLVFPVGCLWTLFWTFEVNL
jgi:hypothetical protein